MVGRRRLRVRPVAERAPLADNPMDPSAATNTGEYDGDELVLNGVLRPKERRVHRPGGGHDGPWGASLAGLGHQRGTVLA
jgi:hypothetical protein